MTNSNNTLLNLENNNNKVNINNYDSYNYCINKFIIL